LGWNVAQDQRCLSCHADWQAARSKPDDTVLADGVACEACHGPSSKYINEHSNPKWRTIPFHQRLAEYGMTMLRDPQVRAEVCLSCHIGNVEQGKIITHEMYAAGHPPLPSFELRQFGEAMKHWSDVADQLAKINGDRPPRADETYHDLSFIQSQLGEDRDTIPALKTVLYGAVMTLRQSVQLLANEAGGKINAAGATDGKSAWPEFALFDCAMCHHDLRYPAWRQTRLTVAPGRPQISRWPQALVVVAIDQIAGSDRSAADKLKMEFTSLIAALDAPFRRQPFGDPAAIAEPAMKLVAFLDQLLDRMKPLKYNREAADRALQQLRDAAVNGTPDYDSARQISWAFQSIYRNLATSTMSGLPAGTTRTSSQKIDEELSALSSELQLTLNPLRADVNDPKDVCSKAITEADLHSAMQSAATYSPDRFQQHFQALRAELAHAHD
jgi:hypothetical protein